MESPLVLGSENDMLAEDLFEGWLSVPMGDLFGSQPNSPPKDTSIPIIGLSPQQDVGTNLTRFAGAGQDLDSFASPPVSADSGHSPTARTPSTPNNAAAADSAVRKRRGHTKSRLGCINCKKRKVKCQETWPSCANCVRRGCPCRYPTVFQHTQHDRIVSEVLSSPRSYVRLSDTPKSSSYNANDMRLFHHFLVSAHPCIPQEYEVVWVRDVPTFSHQYEYLMNAMLAMAGSHLDLFVDDPQPNTALSHRQKAIEGLEEAFTRWPPTPCEAHVMLATSYLLAFQSSYMSDGMLDHVLSLRGCAMLSQMILTNGFEGAFSIDPNLHGTWFEWKMKNFPSMDQRLAREALQSMAEFAPLLAASKEHKVERDILAQLVGCIRPLLVPPGPSGTPETSTTSTPGLTSSSTDSTTPEEETSTIPSPSQMSLLTLASTCEPVGLLKNPLFPSKLEADFDSITDWNTITEVAPDHTPQPIHSFNALMCSLLILTTSPREPVLNLFSSTNNRGNIVMAHFCCVRFIVAPLSAPDSAMKTPMKAMVEWCEQVVNAVKDEEGDGVKWTKYIEWPQKILKTMRHCLNQNKGLTFGDLYDVLVNDPRSFREGTFKLH